jgi:hypothetical protein
LRDEFNEYTDEDFTPDEETYSFMCNRYGLDFDQLTELHNELSSGFPVRLSCFASEAMIEKDWGESNDGEHLIEKWDENRHSLIIDVLSPFLEELLRFFIPMPVTLLVGSAESIYYRDARNLMFHCVYYLLSVYIHPAVALLFHYVVNMAGPKTNVLLIIMTNKKNVSKRPGKKTQPKKKSGKQAAPRKLKNKGASKVGPYARMLSDPCNAELVPGFYGAQEGILSRYKTTSFPSEATAHGYIAWFPSYTGATGGYGTNWNALYFTGANFTDAPTNTTLFPLGSGVAGCGVCIQVGAAPFIATNVVQDFRTVSACMRAVYTGSVSSCAGRIAILDNVPAKLLLSCPSTAQMFNLSADSNRVSLDATEVAYRPSPETMEFRDKSAQLYTVGDHTTTPTYYSATATNIQPTGFVIAWTGIPSNQLIFDFIQNIEWRPASGSGYIEVPPKQLATSSYLDSTLKMLDDVAPGWTKMAKHVAGTGVSMLANYVLGGPPQRLRIMQ